MQSLKLITIALALAAGLEIPFVSSPDAQLDKWLERAEKLAVTVTTEDLEKLKQDASNIAGEAHKNAKRVVNFLKANRNVVEFAAGGLMLFWGKNVMHLLLFVQTFRLAGLGSFQRAFSELRADFVNTTRMLNSEVPNVVAARDALLDLKRQKEAIMSKVDALKKAVDEGTSTSWYGTPCPTHSLRPLPNVYAAMPPVWQVRHPGHPRRGDSFCTSLNPVFTSAPVGAPHNLCTRFEPVSTPSSPTVAALTVCVPLFNLPVAA